MDIATNSYDSARLPEYTRELIELLRLRTTPTALKFFKKKEDMEAVPKIRIPASGPCLLLARWWLRQHGLIIRWVLLMNTCLPFSVLGF